MLLTDSLRQYHRTLASLKNSPLTWQEPCSLLQWVLRAAPDFQRAHCLCNLSGSTVCFVVVEFTVRVFPDLTINHWLSLYRHAVPRASSSVCKISQSPSTATRSRMLFIPNSSFSIHAVKWPASQRCLRQSMHWRPAMTMFKPFSLSLERFKIPIVGRTSCGICRNRRSWTSKSRSLLRLARLAWIS